MKAFHKRPVEIRNLFNPAFCGLVLHRSFAGYEEIKPEGMPFSLALLILPLCLHKESREVIQANNRSYLLKVIEKNPRLLIGFSGRTTDMLPFTLEGMGLIMQYGCIEVTQEGALKTVPESVRKTVSGTQESIQIQRAARTLGKGFAEIGDRATVYTSLGVRP